MGKTRIANLKTELRKFHAGKDGYPYASMCGVQRPRVSMVG